mgnify:CR=1 FL=1|tara:strand:+ start:454 stop:1194 length:741 start_codon:yes stop_codon:yes gene_type:complete
MKSLFEAKIYHERFFPKNNKFNYSGFYIKFSVEDLHNLKSRFFSLNNFNLFSFYEKDHGYRDGSSLLIWVKDILFKAGIKNFSGRVDLQTFPRVLGYGFNPVCFWYCYTGSKLDAIICEVNNTFGETHNYVIKNAPNEKLTTLPKEFHVSPFYDIKGEYKFDFTKKNSVSIGYYFDGRLQLNTSIKGKEIKWNNLNLLKIFLRYPFYTLIVITLIHFQAVKLYFKKIKYFSKPTKLLKDTTYDQDE